MATVIEYVDPVEHFPGWLVYDATDCRIAAGGCRVQPGLTAGVLATLAGRMTLKQRLLGINVDGAKCGINYDPTAPGKSAALSRFLRFLRAELADRFSMGCDMGTQWSELERLANGCGIRSIKYAVQRAQGLTDEDYWARIRLLDAPVGPLTLGQRRAGHALAQATMEAARSAGLGGRMTCLLQGFGNLGRATACSLDELGVRITGIADEYGCVHDPGGLDVGRMLRSPYGRPVPRIVPDLRNRPPADLFDMPADALVLAAGQDAMSRVQADRVRAPVVVVGANCGLSADVEFRLHRAGRLVIPDFVGGIGGSASMEAIFGPVRRPSPVEVLGLVADIMQGLVGELISAAARGGEPLRTVATRMAGSARVRPADRPYGSSPYLNQLPSLPATRGL